MTQGWGDRAGPLRPHSRTVAPLVFDRQTFHEELVSALVEGDPIDLHYALKLAGEEEREAALAQIQNRIASVQARLDQIEARLAEYR